MKTPHLLLAAGNVNRLRENLRHLLDPAGNLALEREYHENIRGLFRLGSEHLGFATSLPAGQWRQVVSRSYYAAYNVTRALRLAESGHYSQDSTDHKKIDELPGGLANRMTYKTQLPLLRDDRNVCDYDHSVTEADLVIPVAQTLTLVAQLAVDARAYLASRGVTV